MKLRNRLVYSALGAGALLALGAISAPKLHAAIKAAFVEVVIPSKPFAAEISIVGNNTFADGPDLGTLGVTSLTITNYDAAAQQITIFAPVMGGSAQFGCSFGTVIGGGSPSTSVIVQGKSTLHLAYPSPLVFSSIGGHTCVAAQINTVHSGGVNVDITGFVN
ncbi:MAG: hypothetical protein JWP63_6266 [Candidatus Solibacter sp.]|jgi:hypothetical protein|nr:hypothetical protein [Candidatus Solibacter sp.]